MGVDTVKMPRDHWLRGAAVYAISLADLSTPKARAALCMQCHTRATTSRPFESTAPVHPVTP